MIRFTPCIVALTAACATPPPPPPASPPRPAARSAGAPASQPAPKVSLQLYVMSKCPFAAEAEAAVRQALDLLGPFVELSMDYITAEDSAGGFAAMHGPSEVKGNMLQLCALKHSPRSQALAFIDCLNHEQERIPDNWEACAESTGVNSEKLMGCYASEAGQQLLRGSLRRAESAGATGSPTILIAGKHYDGPRSAPALVRAMCAALDPAPAVCAALPAQVKVSVLVLSDRRCAKCSTANMERMLAERLFPGLQVRHLDYSSEEGGRLYRELKLDGLPALLFDAAVEQHPSHAAVARWLEPRGQYRLLRAKPVFDPTAEICDNKIDDTGDGKIDCADPDCAAVLSCRPERPRQLAVFVMSQCPYASQALLAMKEVLKNFHGRLTFDIHYIAEEQDGKLRSMHGPAEVAENIRQLCARKHYGRNNRYLDYVWCRFANYRSDDWRACAVKGISARVIERCASGAEGPALLRRDLATAQRLGITASPTWLVNNRHTFHGISAEQVKQGVCKHNQLKGCGTTLSDQAPGPSGACRD